MKARFFPKAKADLLDVTKITFQEESFLPNLIIINQIAIEEKVKAILKSRKLFKIPGIDSIPNSFLQAIGQRMVDAIAALATACWKIGHYP